MGGLIDMNGAVTNINQILAGRLHTGNAVTTGIMMKHFFKARGGGGGLVII